VSNLAPRSEQRTATMTFKPTMLDVLTTLEISPAILNARADYYETVAARNARAGRDAQVARLEKNIAAMRREAKRMMKSTGKPAADPSKRLLVNAYAKSRAG
jgi:hypothetical protein